MTSIPAIFQSSTLQGSSPKLLLRRLTRLAVADTGVVVISVILGNFLRAVSSVILTRLLMPEVFGISGIIASIQFTLALASDLGFQAFVVRHVDADKPRFLDTVWTVSLIRQFLLAFVLVAFARPLADFFSKPELTPIIAVTGLISVFDGLTSLSLLTALRKRLILRLSVLELVLMVVQTAVSAVLAYLWGSYWAILVGMLASGLLKLILSYTAFDSSFRKLALDRGYLRDLLSFARFITGSSIISLLISQCDKLVLAKVMSLDTFGFYILAGNLASAPLAFATAYSSRILYPTYAELWREGCSHLRERFYAKREVPSLLYSFAAGELIGSAPLIIALLYDDRYASAATYLRILGIAPLLALASSAANETLVATGRISATFEASAIKLAWLAITGAGAYVEESALGFVVAVSLMELPALLLKWVRMHRAGLLSLPKELLFLGAGAAGLLCGYWGNALIAIFNYWR